MSTDGLRFWYEHELARLRASERAGFNVAAERAAIMRALNGLAEPDHGCCGKCNRHHTDQCDECKAYITGTVKLTNGDREIEVALPTDWTTP